MRTFRLLVLLSTFAALAGCRSRVVQVTLINASRQPLSTIVVDYPGATFGVNQLDPGKTFRYRIKPQDTGPLKVQFADADGHNHTYTGPTVHKNDEGAISLQLTQEAATAETNLTPIR
jgi:hypothetical protein